MGMCDSDLGPRSGIWWYNLGVYEGKRFASACQYETLQGNNEGSSLEVVCFRL